MIETPTTSFDHFLDPRSAQTVLTGLNKLLPPGYELGVDKSSIFFRAGEGTDRVEYLMVNNSNGIAMQSGTLYFLISVMNAAYLAGYLSGKALADRT